MIKEIKYNKLLELINEGKIVYVSKNMFGKLADGTFGLLKKELRNFYTQVNLNNIKNSSDFLLEYDDNQKRMQEISKFINLDIYADVDLKNKLFDLKLFKDKQEVFFNTKKVFIKSSSFIDSGFLYTVADSNGEVIQYSVPEYELDMKGINVCILTIEELVEQIQDINSLADTHSEREKLKRDFIHNFKNEYKILNK